MRQILVRWAVSAIPVLFIVSLLTFLLTALIPGDPGRTILGQTADPDKVAAMNEALGVNRPLPVRYWDWLKGAVTGDLGDSITSSVSVSGQVGDRLAVTLSLIAGAFIVTGLVGVTCGVFSALKGGWLGRLIDGTAMLGMAIPVYWFALVLSMVFAVKLRLFPAIGYTPFSQSPGKWFMGLVLPVMALGLSCAAPVAKQTRNGVLSELGRDYVRALRARGFAERTIIVKHVLRNAAAPIITVLGIVVVGMFGGSVLIENVFAMPGLGGLAVSAAAGQDITTMQGVAVVFTVFVIVVNLVIEVLYALVNPKVRTR
ncbi:MAG: ABC transporter permease [Bifidobacteriaceae bacterium]|jgi:peptide/nickel transport system permease protein|nr:ABC transporter permease [Bifidobacteriaceae bacterium]